MEFEITFYDVTAQHISQKPTRNPSLKYRDYLHYKIDIQIQKSRLNRFIYLFCIYLLILINFWVTADSH